MSVMQKVLLLDNFDSFTYNLYDYILQLGLQCDVVTNNQPIEALQDIGTYTCIIISPGPKTPAEAGITLPLIEKFHQQIPILGVCLGHQAIGSFFGAHVSKAIRPVHGKTSTIALGNHPLFNGLPATVPVMRYHSLVITGCENTALEVIATTNEGEVMAVAHRTLPIAGFQFHPESILTPHGMQMLRNWMHWVMASRK